MLRETQPEYRLLPEPVAPQRILGLHKTFLDSPVQIAEPCVRITARKHPARERDSDSERPEVELGELNYRQNSPTLAMWVMPGPTLPRGYTTKLIDSNTRVRDSEAQVLAVAEGHGFGRQGLFW